MKLPVAYQLYSAREDAEKDLQGVLKSLKDMDYDGVEFAGFYGYSAQEIKSLLEQYGLKAVSSHVAVSLIMEDMFGVISYHQKIGCPYIAVPYLEERDRPGSERFSGMVRLIGTFGRLCRETGIQLLYHNHDFEFVPLSGQYALDFLYGVLPPDILQAEIDTCWVKYSGIDPAGYVRKYAGRCPVLHLKDYEGYRDGKTPYALIQGGSEADQGAAFSFKPLGMGCQNIPNVVSAALDSGVKWLVVEQDESPDRPSLVAARLSREYLKTIGQ